MSTSVDRRPVLTAAGAVVLLVLQLGGAALLLLAGRATPHPTWRIPGTTSDLLGTVQHFGGDAFTVTTSQGLGTVRIDAATAVTTLTRPATLADIRPGANVVVWGSDPARVILVPDPAP